MGTAEQAIEIPVKNARSTRSGAFGLRKLQVTADCQVPRDIGNLCGIVEKLGFHPRPVTRRKHMMERQRLEDRYRHALPVDRIITGDGIANNDQPGRQSIEVFVPVSTVGWKRIVSDVPGDQRVLVEEFFHDGGAQARSELFETRGIVWRMITVHTIEADEPSVPLNGMNMCSACVRRVRHNCECPVIGWGALDKGRRVAKVDMDLFKRWWRVSVIFQPRWRPTRSTGGVND
ncbi:hypothetical protein QA609_05235 [Natronococcus sp. A-GB7]|nr:hypothetical protein [Natronococcus sp. A-GB7]MDG5818204.1 hypothetical protein [Natronococcus sp. A-GB7]